MNYNLEELETLFSGNKTERRLRALALQNIIDIANNPDSKDSLNANKLLAAAFWKDVEVNRRGAPSKEEIRSEAARVINEEKQILEDFKRMNNLEEYG